MKSESRFKSKKRGSLDIHEESGQLALKEADIFERFQALARVEGEDTRVLGKDGTVYFEEIGHEQAIVLKLIEVNYVTLLLKSLKKIRFNMAIRINL